MTKLEVLELSKSEAHRWSPRQLAPDRKPWFQQPRETSIAFSDFMCYLMLEPEERSTARVAQIKGKSPLVMANRSKMWCWRVRAGAYEEHYLLLRLDSLEAQRDDMWIRQRELAETALTVVEANLAALVAEIQGGMSTSLKPEALQRIMDTASKIHRMAVEGRAKSAGEAQERHERLAERYALELTELLGEVERETGLTPEQQEKFKVVVDRHLSVGNPQMVEAG